MKFIQIMRMDFITKKIPKGMTFAQFKSARAEVGKEILPLAKFLSRLQLSQIRTLNGVIPLGIFLVIKMGVIMDIQIQK
jgi:hypothetical protein